MKKVVVLLLTCLLTSCASPYADYDPYWPEIQVTGATPEAIGQWELANISYDESAEAQPPNVTYSTRTGDCASYALLMMYLIRRNVCSDDSSSWPQLVFGEYRGSYHAWVRYEGQDYEPQSGIDITANSDYTGLATQDYSIALYVAD